MYEVTDMSTNKMYALKVVHKARLSKSSGKCTKVQPYTRVVPVSGSIVASWIVSEV